MHIDKAIAHSIKKWGKFFSLIGLMVVVVCLMTPLPAMSGKWQKGGGNDNSGGKSMNSQSANHGSSGGGKNDSKSQNGNDESGNGANGSSGSTANGSVGKSDSPGNGGKGNGNGSSNGRGGGGQSGSDGRGNGSSGSAGKSGNAGTGGASGSGGHDGGSVSSDDDSDNDDSDRPEWAGKAGDHSLIPGGGNQGHNTQKGDDYGDLFVMLRNDDGTLALVDEFGGTCDDGETCYNAAILEDGGLFIMLPDVDAPEDVLEVELGRLNISRSPEKVLEHALEEALTKLDGLVVTLAELAEMTDVSGRLLVGGTGDIAIDSPLENLALYQAILEAFGDPSSYDPTGTYIEVELKTTNHDTGQNVTLTLTIEVDAVPLVAASALAAASDKTGTLEIDEVAYLSNFLGVGEELAELVMSASDWYDRETVYDVDLTVISINQDGQPYLDSVNLLDGELDLFTDVTPIDDLTTGIDLFTQAADDSVQVLEYVHESYMP